MVGFETSPWTASWPPQQDRYQLRREFERWIPKPDESQARYKSTSFDEAPLIELCRCYRLNYVGATEDALVAWDACPERVNDNCPSTAELRRRGWLKFDGGRWTRSIDEAVNAADALPLDFRTEKFLWGLASIELVERGNSSGLSARALDVKKWLEDRPAEGLPARDALWLARRLWTELCQMELPDVVKLTGADESEGEVESSDGEDASDSKADIDGLVDRAFLEWQAWCELLHCPAQWDHRWNALERKLCREAALRVIDRQEVWADWEAVEAQVAATNRLVSTARTHPCPTGEEPSKEYSLLNRFDWLNRSDVQRLMNDQLLQPNSIAFAYGLLCSEMEKTSGGPSIEVSVKAVIALVAERPMAMKHMLFKVHSTPSLLVDMLLSERTCAWATRLVMSSRDPVGRQTAHRSISDTQARSFAIQESLFILAHQLRCGRADLLEVASLITWCYSTHGHTPTEASTKAETIGRDLLGLVGNATDNEQAVFLHYLMDQAEGDPNFPFVRFKAVLDAAGVLPAASWLDLSPVVSLYVGVLRDLNSDRTDAPSLPAPLCARLVEIGLASPSAAQSFLDPIDARGIARKAYAESDHSVQYSLARTLRMHVQILTRAVGDWSSSSVPRKLFDALLELIPISVVQNIEKGCVSALTDRYKQDRIFRKEQTSPAQDLAKAWRALDARQQNSMLRVIAESDDPAFLAELLLMLPKKRRGIIRARLRRLGPANAASAWTWPEVLRRIGLLLDVDETKVAGQHLSETESLSAGAPPEVKVNLFDLRLRLLFKGKKWRKLDSLSLPEDLDRQFLRGAKNAQLFWQATSQLVRPAGDLERAKLMFERLAAHSGSVPAYKENAYAAALRLLLDECPDHLAGQAKTEGERLLAEMNKLAQIKRDELSYGFFANRGLLLLSLGRSEEALESLAAKRSEKKMIGLEHVAALAMSKLGRKAEAQTVLDAAIDEFGLVSNLVEMRDSLRDGAAVQAPVMATTTVDLLASIQLSLQRMKDLGPTQVGQLFESSGDGLRGFLVRVVSKSVAGLQHMGAILRDRPNVKRAPRCNKCLRTVRAPRSNAKFENDLNTALKEILGAYLAFIRWDVADQSLGGSTKKGNPGERDLVIRASGQEIAVLEALVCKSVDKKNIKNHFHKLVDYGKCGFYFHVIYSYKPLRPIIDYVGEMIRNEVPASFVYRSHTALDEKDHEIAGFIATYEADHRAVDVVFLIVELIDPSLRDRPQESADMTS